MVGLSDNRLHKTRHRMFKQQEIILDAAPGLRDLLQQYAWQSAPDNWLELAEEKSRDFVVILPFVGAFSAGKSTLINALVGERRLFATNIDPETAYPAELGHGSAEQILGHLPDGTTVPLSRDDLAGDLAARLPAGSHVRVSLPHPLLARLPHLHLVDMPGWDSGIHAHAAAIDDYAARSLAYCVVVSAEEGNLRESLRRALRELAVRRMPIIAIISKADKKPAEEVEAVARQVQDAIVSITQEPLLALVKASGRRNQLGELVAALEQLEHRAESLFHHNVAQDVLARLQGFGAHLDTLINLDDLDSENIQAERERLDAQMVQFETRLNDETRHLETRVQPVLARILERVRNALHEDLESLTDEALSGGDLAGSIGSTLRLAVQEGIAREFHPEIKRYLDRVAEGLPDDFAPELRYSFEHRENPRDENANSQITAILEELLKFIPKLGPISAVVLRIARLLEGLFGSDSQERLEEARRREAVRQKINGSVIPDALRQVRAVLQPLLEDHVQAARQKISATIHAQQASHQAALQELLTRLAQGQAAFAAQRARYQADRAAVTQFIARLENAA